jgi:hypothetical protein
VGNFFLILKKVENILSKFFFNFGEKVLLLKFYGLRFVYFKAFGVMVVHRGG